MLTDEALRRMGEIDRVEIERNVRRLYELWAQGRVDEMIAIFSPAVQFTSSGGWRGATPASRGRTEVIERFRNFLGPLENILSVLHEIVIDGERVVVHRTAVGRRRDNARRYQCDVIDFFRFRDGLLIEFSSYPDAAWLDADATA